MAAYGFQEFIPAPPSTSARLSDLADALLYEANVIEELRQALGFVEQIVGTGR